VLVALYIAVIAGTGIWAAMRVLRRQGEALGPLRRHVVLHAALLGATVICALAAALNQGTRLYLLAIAALLYGGSRVQFAWMERHDTTDAGPPLTKPEVARLQAAARRTRQSAYLTAGSSVVFVPLLWIELGWRWALGFLALGVTSLYASFWRLPRIYARTLSRRGVEDVPS
jgi:hypothetical protein